jgi:hypothetical protein
MRKGVDFARQLAALFYSAIGWTLIWPRFPKFVQQPVVKAQMP